MPINKKIKCLVIDDELPAREVLEKHISGVEALELAGTCTNAVEALSFLQSNTVDLLFLDIQMPHILGTNFIRTLKNPPKVIFTTAYRKYAIEGFELDAVDYLLKPISFDRFLKAVNKIFQLNIQVNTNTTATENHTEPAQPFLYLRVDRKMVKVLFNDILFIEGLRDYIRIYTISKTIVTKHQLSSLEEMLPADAFLRIHRSYIISISKIDSYNNETIEIAKKGLPIGRLFKHDVNKLLNTSTLRPDTNINLKNKPGTD
ncbi:MAG TPA: LytTR family DNA-binding domain-containing protein [Chitinophagaceae bacterium]|nr:LytTR family DNA-binding domain-containing protein [Chitinophagaceae bacterium]